MTNEFINVTTNSILSFNTIFNLIKRIRPSFTIDFIVSYDFSQGYDMLLNRLFTNYLSNLKSRLNKKLNFDLFPSSSSSLLEILSSTSISKKKIIAKFNNKVVNLLNNTTMTLKEIINISLKNMQNGKIVNSEGKIIFDYASMHNDYKNMKIVNENMIISNTLSSNMDFISFPFYFINYVKFNSIQELSIYDSNNTYLSSILKEICNNKDMKLLKISLNNSKLVNIYDISHETNKYDLVEEIFCQLSNLTTLESIDISSCDLDDNSIKLLIKYMNRLINLKSLNLSGNHISISGGINLSKLFTSNISIEKLILANNNIYGSGLIQLCKSLIIYNKLKHFNLKNNCLTLQDLTPLCELINDSKQLEYLDISGQKFFNKANNDESEIIHQFGVALKSSPNIKILYLKDIGLNSDNSPYILQHLNDTKIEEIYLDNNHISEIGGVLFANVIKSNKFLKKASLKNCDLNSNVLMCISHALENSNNSFESLNLEDNNFDERSVFMINQSMKNKLTGL